MFEEEIWFHLFFFLVVFLIVFLFTYIINYNQWKKKNYQKIGEYRYLKLKFGLDSKKVPLRKILISFSLLDAFIISFVTTFLALLQINFIWQMLIGFVLLFALIYACYELYGRHLMKKYQGRKENEK